MADITQTDTFDQVWPYCVKSTRYSIYSRSCFMTGEFCSKQANVHREREKLHSKNEINAFVVMNYSEMSDVVYKWKLQSFVESLKKFFYLDRDKQRIACVAEGKDDLPSDGKWTPVTKINVIRADSNAETNYVICNRVCQQMQIADLVIVDVSVENSNVFYEFGMAAALGKLILPICYSKSFYEMDPPEKAKELLEDLRQKNPLYYKKYRLDEVNGDSTEAAQKRNDQKTNRKKEKDSRARIEPFRKLVEHHIDSYPWRRKLFEFYGLRYRGNTPNVGYSLFSDAVNPALGFSDQRYNRFPYDTELEKVSVPVLGGYAPEDDACTEDRKKAGYHIYNLLRNSYNDTAGAGQLRNGGSIFNTLLVYTMDRFLNERQAGQCIINFYRNMTAQIQKEHCFCGDRVGILGQRSTIHDDPKDTTLDKELLYNVSDIIRIGMNQATHMTLQRKIKPEEFLSWREFLDPSDLEILDDQKIEETEKKNPAERSDDEEKLLQNRAWSDEMTRFTKEHIRNRCIPILPDEPVYVDQLKNGIQRGILDQSALKKKWKDTDFDYQHFFNLFHVMLYTLRYTNQVVVDLSHNSLQALFWLGVAHGSDIPAITVRHVPTREELERSGNLNAAPARTILDVAGLWTAYFHSNDTQGFYNSLAATQIGIERNSKLTLADQDTYPERMLEQLYAPFPYLRQETQGLTELDQIPDMERLLQLMQDDRRVRELRKVLAEKNLDECRRLESFYRERFWRRLLRYNDLRLYLPKKDGETDKQPRMVNITWDVDSMAELSHYLSKRKIIGSYRQHPLQVNTAHADAHQENFISIGGDTMPLRKDWATNRDSFSPSAGMSLVRYVQDQTQKPVREMRFYERTCPGIPESPQQAEGAVKKAKKLPKPLLSYRGFFHPSAKNSVFTQFVAARCGDCSGNCSGSGCPNGFTPYPLPEDLEGLRNQIYFGEYKALGNQKRKAVSGANSDPRKYALSDKIVCENKNSGTQAENAQLQLGQILLWRDAPSGEITNTRFWVSLEGISGPSTLALTSLLVDDKQKKERLDDKDLDEGPLRLPLNSLQSQVRKAFMKEYRVNLDKKLEDANDIPADEGKKLKYAACLYLSTVLYQYFLPFLSTADEHRICNGLHACMCAMAASDSRIFRNMQDLHIAEDVLRSTIQDLRGVEALYVVKVKSDDFSKDNRRPVEIRMLKDQQYTQGGEEQTVEMVSCLFRKRSRNRRTT